MSASVGVPRGLSPASRVGFLCRQGRVGASPKRPSQTRDASVVRRLRADGDVLGGISRVSDQYVIHCRLRLHAASTLSLNCIRLAHSFRGLHEHLPDHADKSETMARDSPRLGPRGVFQFR